MCEMYSLPVVYNGDENTGNQSVWNSEEIIEDKVILETEITLRTGPNITMKIHEESRSNSVISGTFESEEDSRKQGVIKVLNDDSESDFYEELKKSPKTPRKVRFGGESFKLRTPESDSSLQAEDNDHDDDDDNDISSITITVTDAISITTRRSLIPVRISSLPSTPKKSLPHQKSPKRHHQSAPNLTSGSSKIPLRKKFGQENEKKNNALNRASDRVAFYNITSTTPRENESEKSATSNEKVQKASTHNDHKLPITKYRRTSDGLSPVPVHNEIELFHNLTRSPERTRKVSAADRKTEEDENRTHQNSGNKSVVATDSTTDQTGVLVKYPFERPDNGTETEVDHKTENGENADAKVYNSFTVCKDNSFDESKMVDDSTNASSVVIEEIVEKDSLNVSNSQKPTLQQSLSSLASEDEIWAKSEALESLVKMLKQPGTCESLEAGPAALLFEALFACHHRDRLHSLADDALTILINGIRTEALEQCIPRVALALCKMGASSGVRLALVVMKKLPPKKLQVEILGKGFGHRTREGSLQILMACARLYPKSDVEVDKIAEFASAALKDRRRRVRHASLETLAAIAQLSSVSDTINIVRNTIKDFPDSEEILQVVRTRLSRKQLPTVDLDGSVRYSSPTDQTEIDWISGSIPKTSHVSSSPSSSASSSTTSMNYWIHNSRHENLFNNGSTLVEPLPKSFEEDGFEESGRVWINDVPSFSNNGKTSKGPRAGVLRPVYILQQESLPTNTGRGYRKYDRGRSFSPPKHQRGQYKTNLVDSLPISSVNNNNGDYQHEKNVVYPDVHSRLQYPDTGHFRQYASFRKSFSSDQLYSSEKLPVKHDQPYSFSLSSRSSSTSTGSSTRSGCWHKDFRSGIPIPVSEGKLKIRQSSSSNLIPSGPLVAKRSAATSPQHTPSSSRKASRDQTAPQDHDSVSHLSLPPPRSSGSESSGYFTPSPPDSHPPAFIKMDTEERLSSDVEEPEALDSSVNNNSRDCVDSYSVKSPTEEYHKAVDNEQRYSSVSSAETNDGLGEIINDSFPSIESLNINDNVGSTSESRPPSNSTIIVPSRPSTVEVHRKSKSVVDLQNFLPEINAKRKSISSAPARNDESGLNDSKSEAISDEDLYQPQHPMPPPSVLPVPSMLPVPSTEYSSQHHQEIVSPSETSKVKLERRFSRSYTRRSVKPSPRVVVEPVSSRPPPRPKEVLQHVLAQMESPVWETTVQGLQGLSKLARQNPEVIENQIHQVCLCLGKQVRNLRSQVSRTACGTAGELFLTCKRGLEMELEEIACPLFQRTADTNRFLRADANAALDIMCEQLPVNRTILVVTTRGCGHQNAVVRAAALRLLSDIVKRLGPERIFQLPKELRDKVLLAGANSLTDGNADARSHGKAIFRHLMGHSYFQRYLHDAVPQNIIRHISKVMASIKSGIC